MSLLSEVTLMTLPTSATVQVESAWIDGGHMNAARYFDLFVKGGYLLMDSVGLGPAYTAQSVHQIFTVEARISYLREVMAGDSVAIRMRLLDVDRVRVLVLLELLNAEHDAVAATLEERFVHVDLGTRRAAAIPDALRSRLEAAVRRHAMFPVPTGHRRLLTCKPLKDKAE